MKSETLIHSTTEDGITIQLHKIKNKDSFIFCIYAIKDGHNLIEEYIYDFKNAKQSYHTWQYAYYGKIINPYTYGN